MSRNSLLLPLILVAVALSACRTELLPVETVPDGGPDGAVTGLVDFGGAPRDIAPRLPDLAFAPLDLSQPPADLAFTPLDFAIARDFRVSLPDFAVTPPDFSGMIVDLAQGDQAQSPDLFTPPPDLATRPPDLITFSDLSSRPADLLAQPDLANPYPAPHTPLPQAVDQGGPHMPTPRLYNITFNGEMLAAQLDALVAALPASGWWKAVMTDYGVGAGTVAPAIHLAEAAPNRIDDTQIQTWLAGKLDGTHPEFGTPDKNSLYILDYPATTRVTFQGATSCVQFGGYHSSTKLKNGTNVSYAVVNRCGPDALNPNLSVLDSTTLALSHEVVEAATDATPISNPANLTVDVPSQSWEMSGGGEVGDLCVLFPGAAIKPNDLPQYVQRSWSNSAAKANLDPCVPSQQGITYFNSSPVLTQQIQNPYENNTTPGVLLGVGQKATIEVDLWSDGPTAPWTVSAVDVLSLGGGQPYLLFSWDKTSGVNGDKLHLTITVNRTGPNGFEPFLIRSTLNGYTTQWQTAVSPN